MEDRCLGTGFVVGPRQVLTCAHVVDRYHGLVVVTPDGVRAEVQSAAYDWIFDAKSIGADYALLTTTSALSPAPLVWLSDITPAELARLSGQLHVQGYRARTGEHGIVSGLQLRGVQWLDVPDSALRSAQLEGGIPAGLSGAPVLVQELQSWLVVGMMCRGGEETDVSLFFGADVLLAFLRGHGLEPRIRPAAVPPGLRDQRRRIRTLVSHGSADVEHALNVRHQLDRAGFRAELFDYAGLGSGARDDTALYGATALLVLWSAHAERSPERRRLLEVRQALRLGKRVLFARLDDTQLPAAAGDMPALAFDLRSEAASATELSRLFGVLEESQGAAWQGSPYPGLWNFEEKDAPVFFGREAQIAEALTGLEELRGGEQPGWFVILGASGTGKSSLLRAGIVPRLKCDPQRWLPLGPIRRGGLDPIERLAHELQAAFARHGAERDWSELRDQLTNGSPQVIRDLIADLRHCARQPEAYVLVLIDPLEELLVSDARERAGGSDTRFLELLVLWAAEASGCRVVATLRSDFLGAFQAHSARRGAVAKYQVLEPLDPGALARVIEEPARLAGIGIEPALVNQLIRDTNTSEALPLLAFKLRELYDASAGRAWLGLREYQESGGGLHGAIARRADAVLQDQRARLSELGIAQLRSAWLSLVNLGNQGQVTRRRVRWAQLPTGDARSSAPGIVRGEPVHAAIQAFVSARLLVSMASGPEASAQVEIAHEALFRAWPTLQGWITQNAEFLAWRMRVDSPVKRWVKEQPGAVSPLVDPELAEGKLWLQREPLLVSEAERRYVSDSDAIAKRGRLIFGSIGVAVAVFLSLATLWALNERGRATEEAARAADAAKLALARVHPDPTERIQILREIAHPKVVSSTWLQDSLDSLNLPLAHAVLRGHQGPLVDAAISAEGSRVATFGSDNYAQLWDLQSGQPIARLAHRDSVNTASFDAAGRLVATASNDGTARVWDARSGTLIRELSYPGVELRMVQLSPDGALVVGCGKEGVCRLRKTDGAGSPTTLAGANFFNATFSTDGRRIAGISDDRVIYVWKTAGTDPPLVLRGHREAVENVAFSPDGRLLASSSYDGTARIWKLDHAADPIELTHPAAVIYVSFSADGNRLATGSTDTLARIWHVDGSGEPVVLKGHDAQVNFVELSPDGLHVVTASQDTTARIWPADASGEPLVLKGHEGRVMTARFSPGGKTVVTASLDHTARVWRMDPQHWPRVLRGHGAPLASVQFSPDGSKLVTRADNRTVRVWSADAGQLYRQVRSTAALHALSLSPDGHRVVATFSDGTAQISRIDGTSEPHTLRGHSRAVTGGEFSPDGQLMLTTSQDKTARIWSADGTRQIATLVGHTDSVLYGVFSPDSRKVITHSADGTARVWSTTGTPLAMLGDHPGPVYSAVFSSDSRRVATVSTGQIVWLWELSADGELLRKRPLDHNEQVTSAQFSPDGRSLVTTSKDRAWLWATDTTVPPRALTGHRGAVTYAIFSPDGRSVATAAKDSARIWNVDGTSRVLAHASAVESLVFSPDGQQLATAALDGTVTVWNSDGSQQRQLTGHYGRVWGVAFTSDGQHLISAGDDQTVRVWNTDTYAASLILHGPRDNAVRFSPDGQSIVAGCEDGVVRVWDVEGRRAAVALRGHEASVRHAEFSADGQLIVSASEDKTARIWRLDASHDPIVLRGHTAPVAVARFSPDATRVVTGSEDGTARVWNADGSGSPMILQHGSYAMVGVPVSKSWMNLVHSVEFSRDGRTVLTAGVDGYVYTWNAHRSGAPLGRLHSRSIVLKAAFNRDSRKVLGALVDSSTIIWDAENRRDPIVLPAHAGGLLDVSFSPAGDKVITTGGDGVARIWNADGGAPIVLSGHRDAVTAGAISPDGRTVVTASSDGTARVHSIDLQEVRSALWAATTDCLPVARREELFAETRSEAQRSFEQCQAEAKRSFQQHYGPAAAQSALRAGR